MQRFELSPNDMIKLLTREPLLIVRLPILKPDLPNTKWRGVNSTNVLDKGLRIGEIGRWMNSKVNSVKQGGYERKRGCRTRLASNLSHTVPS
jgi:hypothetical protein